LKQKQEGVARRMCEIPRNTISQKHPTTTALVYFRP
jgi:hypothetical protein